MKARIACKRGHPFTAASVRWKPNGGRECKICQRSRDRKRYSRQVRVAPWVLCACGHKHRCAAGGER
jgi:hypothetical protein